MKFTIRGENVSVTEALRDYIEKKISRLERYFDSPTNSEVYVNLKVYNDQQTIEVTIPMKNLLLRAEERHVDMYAAIDLVSEKLERQVRKYKTRINRKARQNGSVKHMPTAFETTTMPEEIKTEEDDIQIVRTKRFNLKPMDVTEAILQMDMLGHNFFVFLDAETNNTNVVYRRKDGKYGLIEPE